MNQENNFLSFEEANSWASYHCVCGCPDASEHHMVLCDLCNQWYHLSCFGDGISFEKIANSTEDCICKFCKYNFFNQNLSHKETIISEEIPITLSSNEETLPSHYKIIHQWKEFSFVNINPLFSSDKSTQCDSYRMWLFHLSRIAQRENSEFKPIVDWGTHAILVINDVYKPVAYFTYSLWKLKYPCLHQIFLINEVRHCGLGSYLLQFFMNNLFCKEKQMLLIEQPNIHCCEVLYRKCGVLEKKEWNQICLPPLHTNWETRKKKMIQKFAPQLQHTPVMIFINRNETGFVLYYPKVPEQFSFL